MIDRDGPWHAVRRLADTHLDPPTAERWLRLVRPAVHLLTPVGGATYDDHPLVGRLGGLPHVPADFSWPVWEGHGPLPLVAEIDLAAVAAAGLDPGVALPATGRLLAFFFDGPFLQDDGMVSADEPETQAGMRLLHLDDDPAARVAATPPPDLHVYPARPLRGRQAVTHPRWEDPALVAEFADPARDPDDDHWLGHPVNAEAFDEALEVLRAPGVGLDDVAHQLGGWASSVQRPAEEEVADDPLRWRPVLQIGSEPRQADEPDGGDDEMMWGDLGALYWLARDDRLPGLTDVRFTWQCG